MEKKRNKGRKNTSRLEQIPSGTESGQAESDEGVDEIFGVHVISDKDTTKHFGVSPWERGPILPIRRPRSNESDEV